MTTRKQTKTKVENITRIEKLVGKTYNTLRRWKQDLNLPYDQRRRTVGSL